jgi:hypothetical protein
VSDGDLILAPAEFLHWFRGTIALHLRRRMIPGAEIRHYVLHKGMLEWVDSAFLEEAARCVPSFANEVFVVFSYKGDPLPQEQRQHLVFYDHYVQQREQPDPRGDLTGVVITTHNRPQALVRTLRTLARADRPVVVVDDGSAPTRRIRNRRFSRKTGATYVWLPGNLGLAHALNVGICHWLASPDIEWISVFNDDVDVAGDLFTRLDEITHSFAPDPPLLFTGHHNALHPVHGLKELGGRQILLTRSCSGLHLHAHRDYWQGVLPIPTAYAHAPAPAGGVFPGQGSETDWWIASWSPNSVVKRGSDVIVVPGLVSHASERSTWDPSLS